MDLPFFPDTIFLQCLKIENLFFCLKFTIQKIYCKLFNFFKNIAKFVFLGSVTQIKGVNKKF